LYQPLKRPANFHAGAIGNVVNVKDATLVAPKTTIVVAA
jgi:hypothetical protein